MDQSLDMKTRQVIHPLDFQGVRLEGGRFQRQFDDAVRYFTSIPDDDILIGFRRRAGLAHPGNELGGWYSNDGSFTPDFDETFNTFGQWISALSRMYAVTQDEAIRVKVERLILEWGKTIEPDGYFFYSWNCNAPHYVYEKMVCGLTDALLYCSFGPAKDYLARITAWAVKNLARTRLPAAPANFTGGDLLARQTDNEWYTLSENLYRAFLATGDADYRDFARLWHYHTYWEALANGHAENLTGLHGYSHVNNVCGAAMAYQVSGDGAYLKIAASAYTIFKQFQWMASGGYAPGEHMASPDGSIGKEIETNHDTFEVPCGSWAGFKLSRYLLTFTGKADYAEWIERLLYNGIGAALPMNDNSFRRGRTFYYADYRSTGGRKVYFRHSFPCCSGTYPQAVSEYHNLIYYYDERSLYVSQFVPSSASLSIQGKRVRIWQRTDFPESPRVALEIDPEEGLDFSLKIRIPTWTSQSRMGVKINGAPASPLAVEDGWLVIPRRWAAGDRVEFTLSMSLRFEPISSTYPRRAALMVGPVMVALKGEKGGPLVGDFQHPEDWIRPVAGQPLHFQMLGDAKRIFVPFYELGEREPYFVYNDVVEGQVGRG